MDLPVAARFGGSSAGVFDAGQGVGDRVVVVLLVVETSQPARNKQNINTLHDNCKYMYINMYIALTRHDKMSTCTLAEKRCNSCVNSRDLIIRNLRI